MLPKFLWNIILTPRLLIKTRTTISCHLQFSNQPRLFLSLKHASFSLSKTDLLSPSVSATGVTMEASGFFSGGYFGAGQDEFSHDKREQKPGDHFIVEDLLDFPNDDDIMTDGFFDTVTGNSTDSSTVTVVDSCNSSFSGSEPHFSGNFGNRNFTDAQFSGELCVPVISEARTKHSNLFPVTLLFSHLKMKYD